MKTKIKFSHTWKSERAAGKLLGIVEVICWEYGLPAWLDAGLSCAMNGLPICAVIEEFGDILLTGLPGNDKRGGEKLGRGISLWSLFKGEANGFGIGWLWLECPCVSVPNLDIFCVISSNPPTSTWIITHITSVEQIKVDFSNKNTALLVFTNTYFSFLKIKLIFFYKSILNIILNEKSEWQQIYTLFYTESLTESLLIQWMCPQSSDEPPKNSPVGVERRHWLWYTPVLEGLCISTLTSVTCPGVRASTMARSVLLRLSPEQYRRLQPGGQLSSPTVKFCSQPCLSQGKSLQFIGYKNSWRLFPQIKWFVMFYISWYMYFCHL